MPTYPPRLTILPIVRRELRLASVHRTTWVNRTLLAAVGGSLTLWTLANASDGVPAHLMGSWLFQLLSQIAAVACLLPGIFLTADALSQEKREGTLGLLFLTDLRSLDVLLGKLAATSLNACLGVLAVMPMLALPLVLGGVTGSAYLFMAMVLANLLWLSLTTGLLISAVSWHPARAMFATAVAMLAVGGLLIGLGLLGPRIAVGRGSFFLLVVLPHAGGLFCLRAANRLVLRSWQAPAAAAAASEVSRKPPERDLTAWSEEVKTALARDYARLDREHRQATLDRNPAVWLAGTRPRWPVWFFLALGIVLCLLGNSACGGGWETSVAGVLALLALHGFLKVWVAWEASRRFPEARRLGMLELMLVTPLGPEAILRAQFRSLGRQFLGPVVVLLLFDLLLLAATPAVGLDQQRVYRAFLTATFLQFVVDLAALAWLGLSLGLTTGKAVLSAFRCVVWVMGVPTILTVGLWLLDFPFQGAGFSDFGLVGAWVVLGLGFSMFHGGRAANDLRHNFRRRVAGG